jgi:hypothetical protein
MRDICTSDVVSNILASLDIGVLDGMFVIICSYGLCVMVVTHIIPSDIIITLYRPIYHKLHHTIYLKKVLAISNIRENPSRCGERLETDSSPP